MSATLRVTHRSVRSLLALVCAVAVAPGNVFANVGVAPTAQTQTSAPAADQSRIPSDQLDSLVAPIALHPDPLLAQVLAASTYPLELVQLQQWLAKNKGLKDKALVDAVSKQPWDASVQAMAALPDIVKWLTDDIQWTTDVGNAFLAQQSDVMDAVQRMRAKATMKGNLTSTEQQTVETRVVENKQVIVIEQANPQVVYVPSYNPEVVYGPPVYPYPPIYYPPPGYYAAGAAISFGVGLAMGAVAGGGWGWGAGWGHNDININTNNNFNRNANINRSGNINGGNRVANGGSWQHNPQHRGGAPYRDGATANKFGGTARGDSLANRQAGARQQVSRQGGNVRSGAVGTTGTSRAGGGAVAGRAGGGAVADRAGGGRSARAPGSGAGTIGAGGGADRVGSRDLSRSSGGSGAFGGGSGGFSGSAARDSSQRGSSSVRSGGGSRSSGSVNRSGGGSHGGGGGRSRGGGGRR